MPFIITDPCIETKDTACVDVCPVDCIHPRKDEAEFAEATMLYIHPEECIDCGPGGQGRTVIPPPATMSPVEVSRSQPLYVPAGSIRVTHSRNERATASASIGVPMSRNIATRWWTSTSTSSRVA